jgi:hypothetical protein
MDYLDLDVAEVEAQAPEVTPFINTERDEPVSRDVFQMLFMLGLLVLIAKLRGF